MVATPIIWLQTNCLFRVNAAVDINDFFLPVETVLCNMNNFAFKVIRID